MATYPLAVVWILLGVLVLLRGRAIAAGLLLALGVVTYEGVMGLAFLAMLVWVLADYRGRWRKGLVGLIPVVLAAGALFALSPKREGVKWLGGFDRLVVSQFGVGVFHWITYARLAAFVFMMLAAVLLVIRHERWDPYRRTLLWGFVILAAAWGPYFLIHWPIATDGFFDRANGVVGVGTAVLLGAVIAWVADMVPAFVGVVAVSVVLVTLLGLNVVDLRDVKQAVDQGQELLANVSTDVAPTSTAIQIVPPPEDFGGYAQFPSGTGLSYALLFRRGDDVTFFSIPDAEERRLPADHLCYDREARVVEACPEGY